jgi:uncharacterized protein (TIGR03067 family)
MRHAIGLTFVVALALPACAQDKPAAEDEKLYGTWVVASLVVMGDTIPDFEGPTTYAFSKGGRVVIKGRHDELSGTFKVALTKSPQEIDLIWQEKDKAPKTTRGLYRIDGDTLLLAISPKGPEGERPTAFDSKTFGIITFKRQKP